MSDTAIARNAVKSLAKQLHQLKRMRHRVNAGQRPVFDARIEVMERDLETLTALLQPTLVLAAPTRSEGSPEQ